MHLIFANLLMTLIIGASINQSNENGLIEARKITEACNKLIEITKNVSLVFRSTNQDYETRSQLIALGDFLNSLEPVELFCQLSRLGKMETIFIYSFLEFSPCDYVFYARYIQNLIGERTKKVIFLVILIERALKKLYEYKETNLEMNALYRDLKAEFWASINLRDFFSYFDDRYTTSAMKESIFDPSELIKVQREVQKAVTSKHIFLANNLYHSERDILFWLIYNHSLSSDSESPNSLALLHERIIVLTLKWREIDYSLRTELLNLAWIGIERAIIFGGYPETKEINLTIHRIFMKMFPFQGWIPI